MFGEQEAVIVADEAAAAHIKAVSWKDWHARQEAKHQKDAYGRHSAASVRPSESVEAG